MSTTVVAAGTFSPGGSSAGAAPRRLLVPPRVRRPLAVVPVVPVVPVLIAASAAAATDGEASRKPNSGVTSLAGISGALMPVSRMARPSFRLMEAIFMMSMKSSATAMRSDEVFGLKLITSARTPLSWSARMAGAKSPSPETTTAMSIRSARRNRSTTSSMSRLAFMRPSPNLRMSLTTGL